MSFNNVKLVHTFGSFIYFAFPASADNMSDMRSGGGGGGGGVLSYKKLIGICRWIDGGRIFTTRVTLMGGTLAP